ncbi:MAG: penicillin-binding protein activator [Pseudomonadota bacterium]
MSSLPARPVTIGLFAVLWLAGCATAPEETPERPAEPADPRVLAPEEADPVHDQEQVDEAQQLAHDAAYVDDDVERIDMQLRAARKYHDGGRLEMAGRLLGALMDEIMTPLQRREWRLLTARLEIGLRHPHDALRVLEELPDPFTTPEQNEAIHRLRARAHAELGDALEVARARVALSDHLRDEALDENDDAIWAALQRLRESTLASHVPKTGDVFGGWIELARLNKTHQLRPDRLRTSLSGWEARYPGHPATRRIVPALRERDMVDFHRPEVVAVLLPTSGRFAAAGQAIRDSILAAHFAHSAGTGQRLRFYNTDAAAPSDLLQEAVEDGAEAIIGPLRREAIDDLMAGLDQAEDVPGIPILALNELELEDAPGSHIYRFGLSPESEARGLAARMWQDGYSRVVMLHPRGDWGERVHHAFSDQWEKLGGDLLAREPYGEEATNLSLPVRRVLAVDHSQQRRRDLRQRVGARLHFEPRRRQDIEAIVMASFPEAARQIPPQFSFYGAGDLPIYGTSHLYAGSPDASRDRDLHGVMFSDMPWFLAEHESDIQHRRERIDSILDPSGQLQRLYALGQDAWDLLPRLAFLRENPHERMDGATGTLHIDDRGRVGRDLLWGRFERGLPVLME